MIFSLPSVVCAYSLPEAKLNGPDIGASSMMFHSVCPLNRLTAYKALKRVHRVDAAQVAAQVKSLGRCRRCN